MLNLHISGLLKHFQKVPLIVFGVLKGHWIDNTLKTHLWLWTLCFGVHKTVTKLNELLLRGSSIIYFWLQTISEFVWSLLLLFSVIWQDLKVVSFEWWLFLRVLTQDTSESLWIHVNRLGWLRHLIHIDNVFPVLILNGLQHGIRLREQFLIEHFAVLLRGDIDIWSAIVDRRLAWLFSGTTLPLFLKLLLFLKMELLLNAVIDLVNFGKFLQFLFKNTLLDLLLPLVLNVVYEGDKVVVGTCQDLLVSVYNLLRFLI